MQPPTLPPRSVAVLALAFVALLCLVSVGESFKALNSSSIGPRMNTVHKHDKRRNWEAELSPFSGPPDDSNSRVDVADETAPAAPEDGADQVGHDHSSAPDDGKLGFPLPIPIATPLSIVACWFGHNCQASTPVPGNPTQAGGPAAPTDAAGGGGMFGSVLSILAPPATPAPGSPGGSNGPLGGLLSALSQAAPSPGITAPPAATTGAGGGGGGLAGLDVLGGVASALDGVLGGSDGITTGGNGLLGQLSANLLEPLSALAANPNAIVADPTAAINNLQNQVSAVLNAMPSAMAAGVQLASNVGGDLAEALNATTDLLDGAPDVAGGVAHQVASLLNAGPALATGLPAAAMAAVDTVGGILSGIPGIGGAANGLLATLKNDLSNAAANAGPQMSSMAAVVGSQVAGILPSGLQPLVAAAVASQQAAPPGSPPQIDQLGALLSSLSSSLVTAAPASTDSGVVDSIATSALAGLSSLMGKISQLSLTASSTPPTVPVSTSSAHVAQTTIYYVQTITALMTSTSVQTSVLTFCPSAFKSYVPSAYPGLGGYGGSSSDGSGSGSSGSAGSGSPSGSPGTGIDGSAAGPCPGRGYTCSDCLDGWFCPPSHTPAAQVPCGYGWPCYHCAGGWFCVPEPQTATPPPAPAAPAPVHLHALSTSKPNAALPTFPPTINGYQYAGCYRDDAKRALRDAQLWNVAGGMTSERCVDFCRTQGFAIAGTEKGSQCFCGAFLLDSDVLGDGQCNMSCGGDATKSTMCGGDWALGIWTTDGSVQQAKSPKKYLTSAPAPGWQGFRGVESKVDAATAISAWPPVQPPTMEPELAMMNTSSLESAILAAVAAEASGLAFEPASASGVIESVSMMLNMGMSSIAHDLSLVLPTSKAVWLSGATGPQFRTVPDMTFSAFAAATPSVFPVTPAASIPTPYKVANNPSVAGAAADARGVPDGADDEEGSYVFPPLPGVTTRGFTRVRRAPRRRAG